MHTLRHTLWAVLVLFVGCTNFHYVVVVPGTSLYRSPSEREVIADLPLYHHEPLEGKPSGDPIELSYKGKKGWVPRNNVAVFSYRSPQHYSSEYMEEAIRKHVIEAVLGNVTWPEESESAIRERRVIPTMTVAMVQLAWGAPHAKVPFDDGSFEYRYRTYRYDNKSDITKHFHPAPKVKYHSSHPLGPGYYVEEPPIHPYFRRTHYPELRWRVVRFGKGRRVEKVTYE